MNTTAALSLDAAHAQRERRIGVFYGLAAYLWWGFVVVYFKAVASVSPLEVLAHRVVWSLVLLGSLLAVRGRWREGLRIVSDRRSMLALLGSTALIALNWFTFIWAVGHDRVVQASLGYYINPLVNVLLGVLFLRERLRRPQAVAVGLAAVAVTVLTLEKGEVPVVSLVLAFSFGLYGLLRKTMRADALVGLTIEVTLLLPIAVAYLVHQYDAGVLAFGARSWRIDLLLVAAGAVTALPLLWFANAARRLHYATVGLLQYIAPSLQFITAIVFFGEQVRPLQLGAFGLIWVALALYSSDALRREHRRRRSVPV